MYERLLEADIAIADLYENAIYELGVRHALRPCTTIVISENQFSFPFDLNHLLIRSYEHLATGIDFEEADRLKNQLMDAISTLLDCNNTGSPVYPFLPHLNPPVWRQCWAWVCLAKCWMQNSTEEQLEKLQLLLEGGEYQSAQHPDRPLL